MARKTDASDRRIYRSFSGEKPTRTVAMMWNSYRFQSKAVKTLMEHLRVKPKPSRGQSRRSQ
jgi:LysR family hydrogen peroxide-inducible transcriptional activator